jgi:FkbM family methyltransferase
MWSRIRGLGRTFSQMLSHPVSRRRPFDALGDWLRWQVGARLAPGPVVVPFVEGAVLVAEPGMTGATGNVYHGLHEFEDMGFLLLFLRENEYFGDIGANIGSYSVLAGAVVGAHGVAVEPIAATASKLRRNLVANGLNDRFDIAQVCVGAQAGTVQMSTDRDTTNRVVTATGEGTTAVPMTTLDALFAVDTPIMLKIDVEGLERDVLAGASRILADPTLQAIVLEVIGTAEHAASVLATLHEAGFTPVRCDPWRRTLIPMAGLNPDNGNTIFVRDPAFAADRLRSARTFDIKGFRL